MEMEPEPEPGKRARRTLRRELWEAQAGRCHYCGRPMDRHAGTPRGATLDHVWPRSRGGTLGPGNVVLACRECNGAKGDRREAPVRPDG